MSAAPSRDFLYKILNNGTDAEIIQAGVREPLTELLHYYKKLSPLTTKYRELFSQIIKEGAQKNAYPAFLLNRVTECPDLLCPFIEGFEKYLFRMRMTLLDNILYLDEIPGTEISLSNETKLFIFNNSDQESLTLENGLLVYLEMSKNAELLLEKYRELQHGFKNCTNKCSIDKKYCS